MIKKIRDILFRLKVWYWLKTGQLGVTRLTYRGVPITKDDDKQGDFFIFGDDDFRFRFINKKYKGYGRPRKTDYSFSKVPKCKIFDK